MNKNNFGYLLREGVRGVFSHGFRSFAAVCVTVACLIIMGSFCLISLNLNTMVKELESENEILVYIDESYSEAEAKSVGSQINMIANVESAVFVSRQTALEHFISEQDDPTLFEGIEAQTLRDRFEVSLIDNSIIKQTVSEIEAIKLESKKQIESLINENNDLKEQLMKLQTNNAEENPNPSLKEEE